jgi:hypothetical protein
MILYSIQITNGYIRQFRRGAPVAFLASCPATAGLATVLVPICRLSPERHRLRGKNTDVALLNPLRFSDWKSRSVRLAQRLIPQARRRNLGLRFIEIRIVGLEADASTAGKP